MPPPTPQTLRVFEMFDIPEDEYDILEYINANQNKINVNYTHQNKTMLELCFVWNYPTIAKKILTLDVIITQKVVNKAIDNFTFEPPLAHARELMNALINAGFPKENMLILLSKLITVTNKELLKTLLEQPLNIHYKYKGYNALSNVILNFANSDDDERGVFIEMLRILIQKGADPTEPIEDGRNAFELVNDLLADRNPRAIIRILNTAAPAARRSPIGNITVAKTSETNSNKKWQGFTQNDIGFMNNIFANESTAKNFASCPICLKYVMNTSNCYYMKHKCSEIGGYYHKELYDKYKNDSDMIHWCTVCGRICSDDSHYKIGLAKDNKPSIINNDSRELRTCEGDGGGGILEKLARFRRIREHARYLQSYIGKIEFEKAMDELCEEMWNAPLTQSNSLHHILESKKYNFSNNIFPSGKYVENID